MNDDVIIKQRINGRSVRAIAKARRTRRGRSQRGDRDRFADSAITNRLRTLHKQELAYYD